MTRRLGVLGLGAMGIAVARRLNQAKQFDVVGFDVSEPRRDLAVASGIALRLSAIELAAEVEVLLVVLPGAAAERDALLPESGPEPLTALAPGSILIELTTGAPELSRDIERAAHRHGVGFVSAPMAGDPARAAEGTLGMFVAGAPHHVAAARDVTEVLARPDRIRVVGDDAGAAQTAKLLVNALWFGQAALTGEVLLAAQRSGLSPGVMRPLLATSAAGGAFVDDYVPRLLQGDYVDAFGIDGVLEQLDTVVTTARMRGAPAELLTHVRDLHAAARERFGSVAGELLVIKLLEDRAGVTLRADPTSA